MFKFSLRLVLSLVALAWFSFLGGAAWLRLSPPKLTAGALREEVADIVVHQVIRDLRNARSNIRSIVLLPLADDSTHCVTDKLRGGLNSSGVLHLSDRPWAEKIRESLNLDLGGVTSLAEALKVSRERKADAVLFGAVDLFEAFDNKGRLKLDIHLARTDTGEIVFERSYDCEFSRDLVRGAGSKPSREVFSADSRELEVSDGGASRPMIWRSSSPSASSASSRNDLNAALNSQRSLRPLLGWLLALLFLPLSAFHFVRSMVRQQSNGSNAFTLALFVTLDLLMAALLFGIHIPVWIWLSLLAAALAYNVCVMRFALKLES
jgi:hypothetical protein